MSKKYVAEPDLEFVNEVIGLGGETLKKCFQCATCSVVCPISPDHKPFPRKEMVEASWGLRDRLARDVDIWLCHECGDCSTYCPRGARPGDVLSAIRAYVISDYATPQIVSKAINSPKALPVLFGIPAILFAVLAGITMFAGDLMEKLFHIIGLDKIGYHWSHHQGEEVLAHANFYSTWFVDLVFVPLSGLAVLVLLWGLYRFITDIHEQSVSDGRTNLGNQSLVELVTGTVKGIITVLPSILKHNKFSECSENKDRSTAHMMVLYGFIGLFIMTAYAFIALYLFHNPGPYSLMNPLKLMANVAGIALVIGGGLMIKNRLTKEDQVTAWKDWYLIILVFGLGLSGMLTEVTRWAGATELTYFMYYIHLIFIFNMFVALPYSKFAHIVYRTVALGYAEYAGRDK